ncbi:MAG: hypothetical protein MUE69_19100 [Myxococcota bacterium]|jgi:hypothetical protein|nr:hypothetical protein [Myxococcota bacterium]
MTDEVRDVVAKARAERAPSAEDRERVRRRLAVAIAAGAAGAGASAAAGASASATSASGIAAWIKVGLATIALGGVGVVAHRVVTQEETPTVARAPSVAPSEPPTLALEPVVIATTNETELATTEPAPTRRRRATTTDDLARDLEALHEAQRAWRSGDARAVLRHVRAHEDTFPRSQFRAERRALEILALCALGERAEAQRLTRRFLDTAPDSPARRSVLESCGAPDVR